MTKRTVAFADPTAQDIAVTGGKGSALARLVAAELPVPGGFGGAG